MQIKICGITKPEQGIVISELGATALGFICVPISPRYIQPEQICTIVDQIPLHVRKIGVFANADLETIYTTVKTAKLTGVQLHGDESPEFCSQLANKFKNLDNHIDHNIACKLEIIKAFRIRAAADLDAIANYTDDVDLFLLDAYHPQQLGGTGQTLDWSLLTNFQPGRPWWLAGGINPENILDAIQATCANGIDLSSGVEISPGNKDLNQVNRLFFMLKSAGFQLGDRVQGTGNRE